VAGNPGVRESARVRERERKRARERERARARERERERPHTTHSCIYVCIIRMYLCMYVHMNYVLIKSTHYFCHVNTENTKIFFKHSERASPVNNDFCEPAKEEAHPSSAAGQC
jgi:hypothetical protein